MPLCTLQELREKLAAVQGEVQTAVQDPSVCLAFLRPGRIIRVKEGQVGLPDNVISALLPQASSAAIGTVSLCSEVKAQLVLARRLTACASCAGVCAAACKPVGSGWACIPTTACRWPYVVVLCVCLPACVLLQDDWGWGVVVSVLKKPPKANAAVNGGAAIAAAAAAAGDGGDPLVDVKAIAANAASCYIVDTLLPCKAGSVAAGVARPDPIGIGPVSSPPAATDGKAAAGAAAGAAAAAADGGGSSAELTVVPVLLPLVTSFSSLRVTLPDDIRPAEVRQSLLCVLQVRGCVLVPAGARSLPSVVLCWRLNLKHSRHHQHVHSKPDVLLLL